MKTFPYTCSYPHWLEIYPYLVRLFHWVWSFYIPQSWLNTPRKYAPSSSLHQHSLLYFTRSLHQHSILHFTGSLQQHTLLHFKNSTFFTWSAWTSFHLVSFRQILILAETLILVTPVMCTTSPEYPYFSLRL